MGIIFITHDLGVVAQTADKVSVMYLGKLMRKGRYGGGDLMRSTLYPRPVVSTAAA
ncbi:MAG: hypothetical protein CM15mP60_2900 [Alphaproteobacteria bacterium]|nr:MAG: hypothetical protein CM15mP60_2900 [Alphaproteobacteria bacterium]